ncbi:hypothetical protein V6N13_103629 [Hibiscus sabdariffa]|uniref:Uncharacterized protein n=1 Tax=Hibiscus sabdariffa TaxID=183260 RepID=A0ABR2B4R9_9ROSI
MGSRFIALQVNLEEEDAPIHTTIREDVQQPKHGKDHLRDTFKRNIETIVISDEGQGCSKDTNRQEGIGNIIENTDAKLEMEKEDDTMSETNVIELEVEPTKEVTSNERVVIANTTLNSNKHTAVRIGEESKTQMIRMDECCRHQPEEAD